MAARTRARCPHLEDLLGYAIRSVDFAFDRLYERRLAPLGLTYPQYLVMTSLWQDDGVTVGGLGERLSLDSGTLSPLLKRLESAGLIERRRSDRDERRVLVTLTKQGVALQREGAEVSGGISTDLGMTVDEVASLINVLRALQRKVERIGL